MCIIMVQKKFGDCLANKRNAVKSAQFTLPGVDFFIQLMAWNLLSFWVEFLILLKPVCAAVMSLTAGSNSIRIL